MRTPRIPGSPAVVDFPPAVRQCQSADTRLALAPIRDLSVPKTPSACLRAREAADHREDHRHSTHPGGPCVRKVIRPALNDRDPRPTPAGPRSRRFGASCFIRGHSHGIVVTGGRAQLPVSGGLSLVAVVETADLRDRDDDLARLRLLNGEALGAVHVEGLVRSGPVIVGEVAR